MALKIRYANLPKRQRLAVMHPFVLPAGASGPSTSAWLASLPPWTILVLASPLLLLAGLCDGCNQFFNARCVCHSAEMDSLSVEIRVSV